MLPISATVVPCCLTQGLPDEHQEHNLRDSKRRAKGERETILEDGAEPQQNQLEDRPVKLGVSQPVGGYELQGADHDEHKPGDDQSINTQRLKRPAQESDSTQVGERPVLKSVVQGRDHTNDPAESIDADKDRQGGR